MGTLIIAEKQPITSPYDKWRVYRATTKTGSYSQIVEQAVTDLTYYDTGGSSSSWYKITYYDSIGLSESTYSDPMQVQSTNYTTVEKVRSFLQMAGLSDSTNPSVQEIIEVINRKEDEIDAVTGQAWRQRYSGTISGQDTTAQYEMYDIVNMYEYHTGIPVYLNHRKVYTMDASQGDAIEFWNGAAWEDWITTRTESRAGDFWFDYSLGILYIKGYWFVKKPQGIRMKYRYGETAVNRAIEDIATKMVAIDILTGMDMRTIIVQEGQGSMSHRERIDIWNKEVETKLNRFKEWQMPRIMI